MNASAKKAYISTVLRFNKENPDWSISGGEIGFETDGTIRLRNACFSAKRPGLAAAIIDIRENEIYTPEGAFLKLYKQELDKQKDLN